VAALSPQGCSPNQAKEAHLVKFCHPCDAAQPHHRFELSDKGLTGRAQQQHPVFLIVGETIDAYHDVRGIDQRHDRFHYLSGLQSKPVYNETSR